MPPSHRIFRKGGFTQRFQTSQRRSFRDQRKVTKIMFILESVKVRGLPIQCVNRLALSECMVYSNAECKSIMYSPHPSPGIVFNNKDNLIKQSTIYNSFVNCSCKQIRAMGTLNRVSNTFFFVFFLSY